VLYVCYRLRGGFLQSGGWVVYNPVSPVQQLPKKKPRQVAGLRYERGARKSIQPGLLSEEEAVTVYSKIVRISFSTWPRRWVKRAAAAPLITR